MDKKNKPRIIKSYEKLAKDIREQIKLVYPEGYSQHLIEFTNAKGEIVSALPFETDEYVFLIKMSYRLAEEIIELDEDYNADGNLKTSIREKYLDEHADIDYLSENDNFDEDY